MIRRVLSNILYVLGGWMLMCEPVVAFIRGADGKVAPSSALLIVIGIFLLLGFGPILIGALISPGERVREAGLTVLISMGAAAFCGIAVVVTLADPGFRQLHLGHPMPKLDFAPIAGMLNLVVIAAIGWLLYRIPAKRLSR